MTGLKIRISISYALYLLAGVVLFLVQFSGISFQIKTASLLFAVPLTVLAGYYFKELPGMIYGLCMGMLLDAYSSSLCFNSIILTLIGYLSGLFIMHFFNINFASALVLLISASFAYFLSKWLFFYAFSDPMPAHILLHYSLPSAVYTAVCGAVMFFLLRPLLKRIPVLRKN